MSTKAERARRAGWWVTLGVASLLTVMCVCLLFAAIRNDHAISGQLGTSNATVDSVAFDRTIIHFETPDSIVHSPSNGVLYPDGLAAGQLVRVEYDAADPELARVAGRSATLTLLPLGSFVFFTWLIAAPILWWIRRQNRRLATTPEPAQM